MGATAQINEAALADFLANNSAIWTQLMAAGEKAVDYWQSISPHDPEDKEHKLMAKKRFVVTPGDYEKAIRARMIRDPAGMYVRVQDWDPKASWIEYGSKHNAAKAPCAQTRAYMLSQGFRSA
jgi:hypothetical protein